MVTGNLIVPTRGAKQWQRQCGIVMMDLIVAMGILVVGMIPLSYATLHERQMSRALYYRAVALEILDGEIEVLRAGEWRALAEGSQPYSVRADAAKNLPLGRFTLTREGKQLRLEWLPNRRNQGGRMAREIVCR